VARAGLQLTPIPFHIIAWRQRGEYLDVAAIAGAAVEMQDPWRIDARPGLQPLDHFIPDILLDSIKTPMK